MPSTIVRPARIAPTAPATVNASHPLAVGLIALWVANGGWLGNLIDRNDDLILGGNTSRVYRPSTFGVGSGVDDTSLTVSGPPYLLASPSTPLKSVNHVSMMWAGTLLGTTASTSNPRLIGVDYTNNPSTNPFVAYSIYRASSTTVVGAINSAGTFTATSGVTTPSAGDGVAVMTYDRANVGIEWNQTRLTTAATGAIQFGASPRAYTGNAEIAGAARGGNILTSAAAIWNRALSANERHLLHVDPFCMLRSTR